MPARTAAPAPPLTVDSRARAGGGPSAILRSVFSFQTLLAAGLIAVVACTISGRFYDPDVWWHLRMGQIIQTTHSIPTRDLFSYTTNQHAWTAHEWLAQWSIYLAYAAAGYRGLMIWLLTFASLTFILIFALCWRISHNALLSFGCAIGAWLFGTVGMAVRPLILGHCFLALELLILELAATKRRRLWLLPPLFAVWANCHGSYFFGMAVLGVYLGAEILNRRRERTTYGVFLLAAVFAASAIGICCNPVGARLLIYPIDTMLHQSAGLGAVDEWLPPVLSSGRTLAALAAFIGVLMMAIWRRGRLELRDLALTLMAFGLFAEHRRMLFLFGLVVTPILCRLLAPEAGRDKRREHPALNGLLAAAAVAIAIFSLPGEASLQAQVKEDSPQAALDYIRHAGLHGPLLNEYDFGGYFIWAWPEEKVFMDGRSDVFDWTGVLNEYLRWVMLDDDPAKLLDKYHVRLCVLSSQASIARVMPYLPGWRKVYSDRMAVVFAR